MKSYFLIKKRTSHLKLQNKEISKKIHCLRSQKKTIAKINSLQRGAKTQKLLKFCTSLSCLC